MSKNVVVTDQAPAAIGPYSQAIIANGMVFTSGQVGLIPGTKTLVEGGIDAQTKQTLENVKALLEASGTNLSKVLKTTVFLRAMADFAAMNAIYSTYFPENPPARSTIAVADLPLNALIEIETIALL